MGIFGNLFGGKKEEPKKEEPKEEVSTIVATTGPTVSKAKKTLLSKRTAQISKIVDSKGLPADFKARVALVLDFSGSMDMSPNNFYKRGIVQDIVERILPLGLRFDDDAAIDVFIFAHSSEHHYIGTATKANFANFVNDEIYGKFSFGGTDYAPVMNRIGDKYRREAGDPGFVIFITDGDCGDKSQATSTVTRLAKEPIFWQFIGIGTARMSFLEQLDDMPGRAIDNANFFQIKDVDNETDEDWYANMMEEFPMWIKEAKQKGIIK